MLASVGIYGIRAHVVALRITEIGGRMAIGADRCDVAGLVTSEAKAWEAGGVLGGLTGAFAAAWLVAALLFDLHARDPAVLATVDGVATLVAFVSAAIPSVCAVNIDPTTMIRNE